MVRDLSHWFGEFDAFRLRRQMQSKMSKSPISLEHAQELALREIERTNHTEYKIYISAHRETRTSFIFQWDAKDTSLRGNAPIVVDKFNHKVQFSPKAWSEFRERDSFRGSWRYYRMRIKRIFYRMFVW